MGKVASDLQSSITISNGVISGTLNEITGYTGAFSGDEADGHFLALQCTSESGATITVEVVGGQHGPSTLDSDGLIVCRIASTSQQIKVVATKSGQSTEKVYLLTGLTLA